MKFNKGFSLAEMLAVLGIIVVFVAVSAPIFTKKYLKSSPKLVHGQFECYRKTYNGPVFQKQTIEKQVGAEANVGTACTFHPNPKVTYFMVTIVGGGGGGSHPSSTYGGGKAGEYQTMFFPSLKDPIVMVPGTGGVATSSILGNPGSNSTFDGVNLVAKGGLGGVYNIYYDLYNNTSSCSLTFNPHQSYCTASVTPTCSTAYVPSYAAYYVFDCYSYYLSYFSNYTYSNSIYQDSGNNYKIKVTRTNLTDFPYYSTTGQTSKFQEYLTTSGYDFNNSKTDASVTPGKGGDRGQNGSPGGILIVW